MQANQVLVLALCALMASGQASGQLDLKQHQEPVKQPSFDDDETAGGSVMDTESQASMLLGHHDFGEDDVYDEHQYHGYQPSGHEYAHQAYPTGDLYGHGYPPSYPASYPAYPGGYHPIGSYSSHGMPPAHYGGETKKHDGSHVTKENLEKFKNAARILASLHLANLIKGKSFRKQLSLKKSKFGPILANLTTEDVDLGKQGSP